MIFLFLLCFFITPSFAISISVEVLSAGWEDPGFYPGGGVRISVNGVDYAAHGRGVNIVVIDQFSGNVLNSVVFDTCGNTSASASMANYISNIATGRIVLAAVQDEAYQYMYSDGVNALKTLGASSFNQGYRGSWALIGAKGLATGTGLQVSAVRGTGPSTLSKIIELNTPEPGTYFLCLISLIFVTYHRKKRNK